MATLPSENRQAVATWALRICATLGLIGMIGLAFTVAVGFEEPNTALLVVSSLLLFAPFAFVFLHLCLTRELSREQKRIWARALVGRRAPHAFAEYLSSPDRAATAASFHHRTGSNGGPQDEPA